MKQASRRRRGCSPRLPARRQACTGRLDPRDRGVRRGRAARRAQGLAASHSRARVLPQRLSHERTPGRRDPEPGACLSRRRASRRGCRRVRAHRGVRRGNAGSAPERALAGRRALREVVAASARDDGLCELRRELSRTASGGDRGAPEARRLRQGVGRLPRPPPLARRHRCRRPRCRRRAHRPQPLSRSARDARAHEREPRCIPGDSARRAVAAHSRGQEDGDGAGARRLPGREQLRGRGSDDCRDLRNGRTLPPPRN